MAARRSPPDDRGGRAGAQWSLLAWNVVLPGLSLQDAAAIAGEIWESGGGLRELRAPTFDLPRRGAIQVSMNLEDMRAGSPTDAGPGHLAERSDNSSCD